MASVYKRHSAGESNYCDDFWEQPSSSVSCLVLSDSNVVTNNKALGAWVLLQLHPCLGSRQGYGISSPPVDMLARASCLSFPSVDLQCSLAAFFSFICNQDCQPDNVTTGHQQTWYAPCEPHPPHPQTI